MPPRLFCLALICLLALAPPGGAAAANNPAAAPHQALAAAEARLVVVATRLATGNAAFCRDRAATPGWLIGDALLYRPAAWTVARTVYGTAEDGQPFIAALAPNGAAAEAGLTRGMAVHAIGGVAVDALPAPPGATASGVHRRIAAIDAALRAHPLGQPLLVRVGTPARDVVIAAPPGCTSEFRLEPDNGVVGLADGRAVMIPRGLVDFADSGVLLAAVVAHEFAHNILAHRARLTAAGVATGLARQFGRSARLSRAAEVEADRLSVWLLAGAGYDPGAAADYWTRYGRAHGKGLLQAPTHPGWRTRVAAMQAEQAAAQGQAAWPGWAANPPPFASGP